MILALLEMFLEHISDKLHVMITSVGGYVCFMNDPSAVGAGSVINIINTLDIGSAAYSEVMSTARTPELNLAH